jgi:hypothetical protein
MNHFLLLGKRSNFESAEVSPEAQLIVKNLLLPLGTFRMPCGDPASIPGFISLSAAEPSYFREIRPVLQRSCQGCHQPNLIHPIWI